MLAELRSEIAARAEQFSWVGYLSTTGVYGDHGGGWVDEQTPLTPATARGLARVLLEEEAHRKETGRSDQMLPWRPDHGHALLTDADRQSFPGYPLIGRMRGLAEMRGVFHALESSVS